MAASRAEAAKLDLPFLGELPLSLDVRVAGDCGHADRRGRRAGGRRPMPRWPQRLVAGGMA